MIILQDVATTLLARDRFYSQVMGLEARVLFVIQGILTFVTTNIIQYNIDKGNCISEIRGNELTYVASCPNSS